MDVVANAKWKSPRGTIANKFSDNDFGYVTHGSLAGIQVYKLFDLAPSVAKELTILDYGCGTGREARILSPFFKQIIAYDPTPECLVEFKNEITLTRRAFPNILITGDINQIPECDLGYSMHVIEHLDDDQANLMISNLQSKVKGSIVLAYGATKNVRVMAPFLTPEQVQNDFENRDRRVRIRLLNLRK